MLILITFFTSSQYPYFLGMKKGKQCDEKHGKTLTTITSTPKDRPPEVFKMYAQFFICSLHHLIQALWACWKQTDENLTNIHEMSIMALRTVNFQVLRF